MIGFTVVLQHLIPVRLLYSTACEHDASLQGEIGADGKGEGRCEESYGS